MNPPGKPLVWLHGEIKTPPFSAQARVEAGFLLREVQSGRSLTMPHSRPMPAMGPRCHELRVKDARNDWRIVYRIDPDAVITRQTPLSVITDCKRRLRMYDQVR
jgi:phage-related protein